MVAADSPAPAAASTTQAAPTQAAEQALQVGRFFFKDGTTYEGQYKLTGLPPAPDAAPAGGSKKPAKKPTKEEEAAAQPAEPPKPVRHGTGTLTCGAYCYCGDWCEDEMHGQGRFSFASGAVYQGCFEHNAFQGEGSYTFADGKQYKGQWVANVMHGHGCFIDAEGHAWEGHFYNGSGPGLTYQL